MHRSVHCTGTCNPTQYVLYTLYILCMYKLVMALVPQSWSKSYQQVGVGLYLFTYDKKAKLLSVTDSHINLPTNH